MKFIYKIFVKVLVASFVILLVLAISKGWQLITDGFRVDKIKVDLASLQEEDIQISPEKKKEIFSILKQEFHYIDKGCQTYVFESFDKDYVIKFIRFHKYRLPFWMHHISFISKGRDYKERRKS